MTALQIGGHGSDAYGSGGTLVPRPLTRRQKAAVIVRLLLSEGATLPLSSLSDETQVALTAQMAQLRLIDRATLQSVIDEFAEELEAVGLHFPRGIEGALDVLDGHISPATAARLRREAGVAAKGDPWERIAGLDPDRLARVLEEEAVEVGAVMLSKLAVSKAADLLGRISAERARKVSYAISKTGKVDPETVRRIGLSLAAQLDAEPIGAFSDGPVARVGAILNSSRAATRDEVLAGLDEADQDFANEVRRAIFTFANLPGRVAPRDLPRIIRGIDQAVLVVALAFAKTAPETDKAAEYLLENISKRMADTLREEIAASGPIKPDDGEDAMGQIVGEVRRLVDNGELVLLAED